MESRESSVPIKRLLIDPTSDIHPWFTWDVLSTTIQGTHSTRAEPLHDILPQWLKLCEEADRKKTFRHRALPEHSAQAQPAELKP